MNSSLLLIEHIRNKYGAKLKNGNYNINHYGDCDIYSIAGICTCGLIKDVELLDDPGEAFLSSLETMYRVQLIKHKESLQLLTDARDAENRKGE